MPEPLVPLMGGSSQKWSAARRTLTALGDAQKPLALSGQARGQMLQDMGITTMVTLTAEYWEKTTKTKTAPHLRTG